MTCKRCTNNLCKTCEKSDPGTCTTCLPPRVLENNVCILCESKLGYESADIFNGL